MWHNSAGLMFCMKPRSKLIMHTEQPLLTKIRTMFRSSITKRGKATSRIGVFLANSAINVQSVNNFHVHVKHGNAVQPVPSRGAAHPVIAVMRCVYTFQIFNS